jgi:3-methyladenine DNA glycosylase AlkD
MFPEVGWAYAWALRQEAIAKRRAQQRKVQETGAASKQEPSRRPAGKLVKEAVR